MSTFAEMRAVIADDLDRTDMTTQINRAINRAIKHYEKDSFWFKQTVSTFSCVAAQKIYTTSIIPTDIASVDYMEVVVSGNDYKLTEKSFEEIEEMDVSHQGGIPDYYAYYNDSIYLYPIPNTTYTIRIAYTKTYTTLSADSDTNDWTTEAEDLIEARALWTLYARTIKDDEEAQKYKAIEEDAKVSILSKTEQHSGTSSTIRGTDF